MKWNSILIAAMCLACVGCRHTGPPPGEPVDLTPDDPRPILQITVTDEHEVALLQQQLRLEPIYNVGTTLYFYDAPGLRGRLEEVGYRPTAADPVRVFHRVVRVWQRSGGSEEEVLGTGVTLINREEKYWVVRGTLAQLRTLERLGYQLTAAQPADMRAREVRILVLREDQIGWLAGIGVDIYSVEQVRNGWYVYGGAFDRHIDQIRANDLNVERISTVD